VAESTDERTDEEKALSLWLLLADPKYASALTAPWVDAPIDAPIWFNRQTLRYGTPDEPSIDPQQFKLDVLLMFLLAARQRVTPLTDEVLEGRMSPTDWADQFEAELWPIYTAAAIVGSGGLNGYGPDQRAVVRRSMGDQLLFASVLTGDINAFQRGDTKYTRGELSARIQSYVTSALPVADATRGSLAIVLGYDVERNILGPNEDHCETGTGFGGPGCLSLGTTWVPIGTHPLPGRRACGPQCKCVMAYGRSYELTRAA
jgi:hypothetical protein